MQTATILRRIEKLPALSRAGKRINGLHRLMRSRCLYERAYDRVSRNRGAMTPGVDGQTFDGVATNALTPRMKNDAVDVAFSSDGHYLAALDKKGQVSIWAWTGAEPVELYEPDLGELQFAAIEFVQDDA